MIDTAKFKDLYVSEAEDHLQKLNDNLLILEKDPHGVEIMNELMRSSHTLKGSSATMGYTSMALLMHVMEDIFDYARTDKLTITLDIVNELFATFDALEHSLESIKTTGVEADLQANVDRLKAITNVQTEGVGKSAHAPEAATAPAASTPAPASAAETPAQAVVPTPPQSETKPEFKVANEEDVVVEKIEHIKVPIKRLDILFDLVEELLIAKMRIENIAGKNAEFKGEINRLERLISDIQYQVMQTRLVPVDQVFARFPRMIRDLAIVQKKKIDLQISGGDIELDRTIIDKLGNPLVHLIRNAVDHGIDKEGTITLRVVRDRDAALVMVENTGQSIDYEKVREIAVKRGMVSKQEAPTLTREDLAKIIFQPHFSTSEVVTEISGRGVGLSAVQEFVTEIGGQVYVESPPKDKVDEHGAPLKDAGTRFTLELPLKLAIVNSLLVKVSGQIYAIPFANIVRSVQVPMKQVKSMGDQDVAIIGDTHVMLVKLNQVFGFPNTAPREDMHTVVLVQRGEEYAGLVVDTLLDEQEIIAKSLPESLKGVRGFSGSTILGDGKTIMILDVPGLLKETTKFIRVS